MLARPDSIDLVSIHLFDDGAVVAALHDGDAHLMSMALRRARHVIERDIVFSAKCFATVVRHGCGWACSLLSERSAVA